jgi:cytidine deaminase
MMSEFLLNREIIDRLIDTAKKYADNAYCPYSNTAVGAALLCADNVVLGGCNIENEDFGAPSFSAGDTALAKAVSEGYNDMKVICLYSEKIMPYPNAITRQYFCEFNPGIKIIVANAETHEIIDSLSSIYLFPPSRQGVDEQ